MTTQQFKTTITKSGAKTFIVLPFNPNDVWGVKERHHITGSIDGSTVRGALDTDGEQYSLSLGATWRRDHGLASGAQVEVILSPEGPQIDDLSPDIAAALIAEPQAKTFFEALATFYRTTYIKWIEGAKRPETRAARIEEMVELLKAGQKRR